MDDPFVKQMIAEAVAYGDEINPGCDELLQRLEQRRRQPKSGFHIVRKIYNGDQPSVPTSWSQPQPTMTTQQQEVWDQWAHGIAGQHAAAVAEVVGQETGKIHRKQDDQIATLVARLDASEARLDAAEARLAALESEDNNGSTGGYLG